MVADVIADPAKLGIVGWSYGGYAALQSVVLDGSVFCVAISRRAGFQCVDQAVAAYGGDAQQERRVFAARIGHVTRGSLMAREIMERETRLELATSTLARLRSTN